jgi:hypothetical protein
LTKKIKEIMIWFNTKELEKQLIDGALSDRDSYYYLFTTFILFSLLPYLPDEDFIEASYWFRVSLVIVDVGITAITIKETYKINQQGDSQDYLKRFLSLSFVNSIRLAVYLAPVFVVLELLDEYLNDNTLYGYWQGARILFLTIASSVIFYFMLTNSFKRVNLVKS